MPTVRSLLCVLVVLALTAPAGWAAGTSVQRVGLYSATRIIARDAGSAEQVAVLQDALREVFKRVIGRVELPEHPALAEALESPQALMNQFNLEESDITLPDAIGNPKPTYSLHVEFSAAGVQSTLAAAGEPVWGAVRPRLTLVLAGPQADSMALLRPDSLAVPPRLPAAAGADESGQPVDARLLQETQRQVRALGLPVQWPLLDLVDLEVMDPDAVWLGDTPALREMQERYGTRGTLAGYLGIDPASSQWVGRWHLLLHEQQVSATVFGETSQQVIKNGLATVVRHLAAIYAVDYSQSEPLARTLEIQGVDDFAAFASIRRYLAELAGTASVRPLSLRDDRVRYRLETRADADTLTALIGLTRGFEPLAEDAWSERNASAVDLRFRWQGGLPHGE